MTSPPKSPSGAASNWNGQLRECSIQALDGNFTSFGVLSFPVESLQMSFSQDLVQHKKPYVRGAQIEATGFNPHVFKIRAPFINGYKRSKLETWSNLFPDQFTLVYTVLTDDRSPTIDFVHPTLGHYTCKAQGGDSETTYTTTNGQVMTFELIETHNTTSTVAPVDVFASADYSASQYDTQIQTLTPPPPANIRAISLTQLMQQVKGTIDTTTLQINRSTAVINHAVFQVRQIEDSLTALNSAATAAPMKNVQAVKAGLLSLKQGLLQNKSTLLVYTVPAEGLTLAAVAQQLQNSPDDLIRLNPALCKVANLPQGQRVVYVKATQSTSNAIAVGLGV